MIHIPASGQNEFVHWWALEGGFRSVFFLSMIEVFLLSETVGGAECKALETVGCH